MKKKLQNIEGHVVLVGAGIMSATLGILLKELNPKLRITIYERLDTIAAESSDAWNNAGTGHAAYCELNYTPETEDGTIDISKAVRISSSFELSKEFWSYLVSQKIIDRPEDFIQQIPHISFVWGEENVQFLKKRVEAMSKNPLFEDMEYSEDKAVLEQWMPLVMKGRGANERVAATKIAHGTDVNFGALTRQIFAYLQTQEGVQLHLNQEVSHLEQNNQNQWHIKSYDLIHKENKQTFADFVFLGAGGGALGLLDDADIAEGKGYGGFPISGQWLVCKNEDVIAQHEAKVYGKASVGAPPMSVPHLDTRWIDGKKTLLFGPFAGFTTKFLKHGSYLDLARSIELDNIVPMLGAGVHNIPLTKYLIEQVSLNHEDRVQVLKEYLPNAEAQDWELAIAGQRVQIIKKDEKDGGKLEFGTEIIASADCTMAALLGASPGASTSVSVMLRVLEKCFASEMQSEDWKYKLKWMMQSYGVDLANDAKLCQKTRMYSAIGLHLL